MNKPLLCHLGIHTHNMREWIERDGRPCPKHGPQCLEGEQAARYNELIKVCMDCGYTRSSSYFGSHPVYEEPPDDTGAS